MNGLKSRARCEPFGPLALSEVSFFADNTRRSHCEQLMAVGQGISGLCIENITKSEYAQSETGYAGHTEEYDKIVWRRFIQISPASPV